MNRRDFLKHAALGVAGALAPALGRTEPADWPNILFLFIDDMGYADPSCFGNPKMKTPHMDRLAAEGVRLTNFYVNSPICSPSRVAVTTGQYPGRWKITSYLASRDANRSRGMADWLDVKAPTTARLLQQSGYATGHFGKWHMGGGRDVGDAPLPTEYGFDESLVAFEGLGDRLLEPGGLGKASEKLGRGTISHAPKHQKTEIYVDRAIDFIKRNKDKPFYVQLWPNDVHDGHNPAPGAADKWKAVTDNPFEQRFFAVLEEMDRQIGRLVAEIDRLGLAERTLIVLTSDNGPTDWPNYYKANQVPPGFTGPFFGRKWSLYEGGIRMPFVARWKGRIAPATTDDRTVMAGIDLLPTFCRLAGVDLPATVKPDGQDMSSALLGTPQARKVPLFWQYGSPHARLMPGNPKFRSPSLAMRDGDWKLLMNSDGGAARLHDLARDPGEKENLLEAEPERAKAMQARLLTWADEIGFGKAAVPPEAAAGTVPLDVGGKMRKLVNHGVKIDGTTWHFDGKGAWLDLPRADAPTVAGKVITVAATVTASRPNGVILAHGGDRSGYALYLAGGRPAFSVCTDWKRTTVHGTVLGKGEHALEARLAKDGRMAMFVDGKIVAEGKAPGPLGSEPGDSLQVGADLIKPVGAYATPNPFAGTMRHIRLGVRS